MTEFDPRKYLMHCLHIARTINPDEAIASAERLEAAGTPLLFGLTDKVRHLIDKAKREGKL